MSIKEKKADLELKAKRKAALLFAACTPKKARALDARTETRVSQQTKGDLHQYYQAMHQDCFAESLQHASGSELTGAVDGPVVWLPVSPR